MDGEIAIRVATAADAIELARLNAAFNGGEEPPSALAERLKDPAHTETALLAEIAGRAIGFAGLRISPGLFYVEPRAELTELYVLPEYRRRGAGRALTAYAEEVAHAAGATELFVLTGFDNHEAQALYRKLGFLAEELALRKVL
jgi:ribosomal protein S18 acetylase RimI-like enzyme